MGHINLRGITGWLVTCFVVMCGCGQERFTYVPVSGLVTLDGQPLAMAKVIFVPRPDAKSDGHVGRVAFSTTDENGKFTLETTGGEKGARVGLNSVAILGEVRDDGDPDKIVKPEYLKKDYWEGKTLSFDVPAQGTKEANFDLVSK